MRKPKILLVSESPLLSTGYGRYTVELLKRLAATNKYQICLLAAYCQPNDPRLAEFPWTTIGNNPSNQQEEQIYNSNPLNQLGLFRFNDVAINFQPDVVFSFSDEWYFSYQGNSILKKNYNWIIQPTVDSAPQNEGWIYTFSLADKILTYSDFGKKTLENAGLKVDDVAFLGADPKIFFPVDKKREIRQFYGIDPSINLIGFVSRNQPRKLFPDLFVAFKKFLETTTPELARKTYLLTYSSYPDMQGWDLPRLIKNLGISSKVLFPYICHSCHNVAIKQWQDVNSYCIKCKNYNCKLPNNILGLSNEQLSNIYSSMDFYVQYANSEGIGIGQLEAAACGVPIATVNFSGTEDCVKKLGAYPIRYHKLICEPQTMCMRAVPDDDDLARILNKFFQLPEDLKKKKSIETARLAKEYCDWDKNAAVWMKAIDECELKPLSTTWGRKPHIVMPNTNVPQNLSPAQLVKWIIQNVLGQPELLGTYFDMKLVYEVSNGLINPQQLLEESYKTAMNNNQIEQARYNRFLEVTKK